jgi:hypothetical protein
VSEPDCAAKAYEAGFVMIDDLEKRTRLSRPTMSDGCIHRWATVCGLCGVEKGNASAGDACGHPSWKTECATCGPPRLVTDHREDVVGAGSARDRDGSRDGVPVLVFRDPIEPRAGWAADRTRGVACPRGTRPVTPWDAHKVGDASLWKARKPEADVLERYVPGYQRGNFVDIILNSDWPE